MIFGLLGILLKADFPSANLLISIAVWLKSTLDIDEQLKNAESPIEMSEFGSSISPR